MVCSVHFSMCIMKWTGADTGAIAGAGAVCSVHCAVCSLQWAVCTIKDLAVEKE